MKDSLNNNKNKVIVILFITFIVGIISATGIFISDAFLETVSIETEATIVSVDYKNGERFATVIFEIDKKEYMMSTMLNEEQEELTINDTLKVKYDIRNPDNEIHNDHLLQITITIIVSLIGIILTGSKSMKIINEYKHRKKLLKDGIHIEASITEVFVDTTAPKIKDQYPYRLRCKFLNPQDNKEYVYQSDYTYLNIEEAIKSLKINTVPVYLDKENTNSYYVDLSNLNTKTEAINKSINSKESIKVENETVTTNKEETIE